jgi:phosphatidylinositol-3-phosphatase
VEKTSLLVDSKRSNLPEKLPPEYQLQAGARCIYPDHVRTIADQLEENTPGHGWRAYMEGMRQPCDHPEPGTIDTTALPFFPNPQHYTPRHNPFVYFRSLIGRDEHHPHGSCDRYDRPLGDLNGTNDGSAEDLKNNDVPSPVFISPNLCNDGHSDCVHPHEQDPEKKEQTRCQPLTSLSRSW